MHLLGSDCPVWPDWAIYCTLGNFSKPAGTIILTKLPKLFGNFCKGVKIFHVSSDIILGNFYWHYATFYWSLCLLPIMTPPVLSLTFPIWILPLTSNLVYLLRVLKFLFVRLLRITQSLHSLSLVFSCLTYTVRFLFSFFWLLCPFILSFCEWFSFTLNGLYHSSFILSVLVFPYTINSLFKSVFLSLPLCLFHFSLSLRLYVTHSVWTPTFCSFLIETQSSLTWMDCKKNHSLSLLSLFYFFFQIFSQNSNSFFIVKKVANIN